MVFDDVVRERAVRPVDRRRGAGSSTTTCTRTRSCKRAAYAWLTDFVGWLPMPDGGEHEAVLTADYNAEMIEHIARFPRVRDRAIFVGNPDDIVPERVRPGLPGSASGPSDHYDFAGYVTGFDPAELGDRERLRAELGYAPDEQVCVVTRGRLGRRARALLRARDGRVPAGARAACPTLRMIVVAGPRIDPASLPAHDGLEVRAYVPDLYRHLAACDLAVVQGGLTTAHGADRQPAAVPLLPPAPPLRAELPRPPPARALPRRAAGWTSTPPRPESIAVAIAEEIGREVDYRPVETDGAASAAALIGELL